MSEKEKVSDCYVFPFLTLGVSGVQGGLSNNYALLWDCCKLGLPACIFRDCVHNEKPLKTGRGLAITPSLWLPPSARAKLS